MEMRKCTNPNEKDRLLAYPYARAVCGRADPLVCGWPPGQPCYCPHEFLCNPGNASSMEIPSSLLCRAPPSKALDTMTMQSRTSEVELFFMRSEIECRVCNDGPETCLTLRGKASTQVSGFTLMSSHLAMGWKALRSPTDLLRIGQARLSMESRIVATPSQTPVANPNVPSAK